jgi:hypothetical protein
MRYSRKLLLNKSRCEDLTAVKMSTLVFCVVIVSGLIRQMLPFMRNILPPFSGLKMEVPKR